MRHGLTLDEAAADRGPARVAEPPPKAAPDPFWAAVARGVHAMDAYIRADKARREAALREARARGLDAAERSAEARRREQVRRSSGARRNPFAHARVLLRETRLPLDDIVDLTGLDVYTVAAMKLKMRASAQA